MSADVKRHRYTLPLAVSGAIGAINRVGGVLNALGLSHGCFDKERLLLAARQNTELDYFWNDRFWEPFHLLTQSLRDEIGFNFTGRMLSEVRVRKSLENRLLIADELESFPQILNTRIQQPIFIVSLPRTGTTFLQNLLAQDPNARHLLAWEARWPVRGGKGSGRQPDERLLKARRRSRILQVIAPAARRMHRVDPDGPDECFPLLFNAFFIPLPFDCSYRTWYLDQSAEVRDEAYLEYRQQLQLIQFRRPLPGHWVLKTPMHLWSVDAILRLFPDANVVLTHRDPGTSVASLCSFFDYIMGAGLREGITRRQLPQMLLAFLVEGLERAERARGVAAANRIHDIHYRSLVEDPLGTVRRLYDRLGYEYSDEFDRRAKSWLDAFPKDKHGEHKYSLEDFGLSRAGVTEAFSWYRKKYDV